MKFLKWFFGILFVLIIAVVTAGYVFLRNFDLNEYKDYAEKIVYEQTGRKLSINGNAELGISLVPTLIINDITFANPSWAKNPQMAKVASLELRFSILPLLSKQIVINKALLNNPQIFLETDKKGQNSWDFEKVKSVASNNNGWLIRNANASETSNVLEMFSDIVAKEVAIKSGDFNYLKHSDNSLMTLKIKNLDFSTEGMNSPMNVSWDIVFNEMDISGKGVLGSISALFSATGEYPIKLDVKALGIKALVDAKIKNMLNDKLSATFNYNMYNAAGNMNIPETTLIGSGNATLKKVALNIDKLEIVNNIIKGKINADISKSIPYAEADLSSDLLDLTNLNRSKPTALNFEIIKSAHASSLVPNEMIPFELLKIANGKANLSINKLIVNSDIALDNFVMNANLSNGLLNLSKLDFNIGSGSASMSAVVNSANKSLVAEGTTKNILLTELHEEFKIDGSYDFGFTSGGGTQTSFNLNGHGSTYRSLVDSLSGQIIAIVEPAEIQTGHFKFMTSNFLKQLAEILKIKAEGKENISLKCAVVRADLKDGVINFPKGIVINSDKLDLVGDGSLTLKNDKLDVRVNAYRSGVTDMSIMQALSNLIKIKGTIQDPKIAIDRDGTIKTIAGIAMTGGALNGAQLLLDKDTAPCYTALKGTIYSDKFEKPSAASSATQGVYQGASQAVNTGIDRVKTSTKDITDKAKSFLNNILK